MNIPYVAFKNLRRKFTRTILLFAIVAVVACTLFAATLFLRSINHALQIGTYRLGADIIVVPESAEMKAKAALLSGEPTQFLMDRSVLDRARTVDGVKNATAQLFIKPASFTCCYNVDVFLIAFDPATDFTVKPWLENNLKREMGPAEIITGRDIPVVPGDTLPFYGTLFTVAGTMEPTGMEFFDRSVFMSLEAAYRMSESSVSRSPLPLKIGRDKISTVLVQVNEDMTPDRVAIHLEHDIPGIKAISSDTVISTVRKQLAGLIHAVLIISGTLWIIVLLIMAFAFSMIVNERRRELGLLRAMGATRVHIGALILTEAATLSALGGAAGIALGSLLLSFVTGPLIRILKLPYLFPSAADLAVLVGAAVLISVCTGLIAALLPAMSTFRQEPYEAIRREE